jgi:hypothetical protein
MGFFLKPGCPRAAGPGTNGVPSEPIHVSEDLTPVDGAKRYRMQVSQETMD